jgi:hypothetical protein
MLEDEIKSLALKEGLSGRNCSSGSSGSAVAEKHRETAWAVVNVCGLFAVEWTKYRGGNR